MSLGTVPCPVLPVGVRGGERSPGRLCCRLASSGGSG